MLTVVVFECCKVNAENDSLNGIIKADMGIILQGFEGFVFQGNGPFIFSPGAISFIKGADNPLFLIFTPFPCMNLWVIF